MSELIQLPPNFLDLLAYHHENLYRGNPIYTNYEIILKKYIDTVHSSSSLPFSLAEIGEVYFPYFQMGKRNSSHLFGLDELIIFALYYTKKKQYKLALDLGANLGLHSLVLKKMGYEVCSFEPDPTHIKQFQKVMLLNSIQTDFLQKKPLALKVA